MSDAEIDDVKTPTFKAKVTLFVRLTVEVEPEGSGELSLRQASSRASSLAYDRVREAFGNYQIEKAPLVEVSA